MKRITIQQSKEVFGGYHYLGFGTEAFTYGAATIYVNYLPVAGHRLTGTLYLQPGKWGNGWSRYYGNTYCPLHNK
ncbi:MAG: hypothetical protein FWD27_06590 [Coriobacteriia bacterium]|nr:hypothetical protein [Coriobacteriia bacterium]